MLSLLIIYNTFTIFLIILGGQLALDAVSETAVIANAAVMDAVNSFGDSTAVTDNMDNTDMDPQDMDHMDMDSQDMDSQNMDPQNMDPQNMDPQNMDQLEMTAGQ